MPAVFIGMGSNLGDRLKNINQAVESIKNIDGVVVEKISSLHQTEPVEAVGPDYLNQVIKINTEMPPGELLEKLEDIERDLGRAHKSFNLPRTIDLDILLYGDTVVDTPELKIPHPRMFGRDFVMKPLLEIEPRLLKTTGGLRK